MLDEKGPIEPFEYVAPTSLEGLLSLMQENGARGRPLAGGTDLIPKMQDRSVRPALLVDLGRVKALSFVSLEGDSLRIGAATTLTAITDSPLVREKAPLLSAAGRLFASRTVRNRATIGGNLCNASPCADTAPPLLALDATVCLQDASGDREIPLASFFLGRGQTALGDGEILREIRIPCRDGRFGYMKLGRRQGFNLSIVSMAAFGVMTNGNIEAIRLALGAVAPTPIRSPAAEEELDGGPASDAAIERAARRVRDQVQAQADVRDDAVTTRGAPTYHRASAAYRVEISRVMARRVLTEACFGKGAVK